MDSNFAKEANSADAVWNLLGRSSGVGRKLFNLYSQGDSRATNIGNYYSCQNRAKHLKKLAKGYKPTKQDSTKQQVPIGRVYVEVPSVHVTQPKPAQLPTGGKRTLAAIQKGIEVYKPSIPKPKGPVLDDIEKTRLSMWMEYSGNIPPSIANFFQSQHVTFRGQHEGFKVKKQLLTTFDSLSVSVIKKQQELSSATSKADAEKLRREIRHDLNDLRHLDQWLSKLEGA